MQMLSPDLSIQCCFCRINLNDYYMTPIILCQNEHYCCELCLSNSPFEFDCPSCRQSVSKLAAKKCKLIAHLSQIFKFNSYLLNEKQSTEDIIQGKLKDASNIKDSFDSTMQQQNELLKQLEGYGVRMEISPGKASKLKEEVIAKAKQEAIANDQCLALTKISSQIKSLSEQQKKAYMSWWDVQSALENIQYANAELASEIENIRINVKKNEKQMERFEREVQADAERTAIMKALSEEDLK